MTLKNQHQLEQPPAQFGFKVPIRFDSLPILTQKKLHRLADAVTGVVPDEQKSWIIRTSELCPDASDLEIVDDVRHWSGRGSKFLYYLLVMGQPDLNSIIKAYMDYRDRDRGKRAYARLMTSQHSSSLITKQELVCFYVGSSSNISLRLKEHLGYGAKATFSLQLAHWTKGLDLELIFICAKYRNSAAEEVYQTLEDTLWDQLKPMFGRKGRR